MATFLVTGGCGFIGSHLCEALVARRDCVRVLDDLSTGAIENLPAGLELYRGSVAEPELVRSAMEDVAGCFHLAAIASVERSTQDWFGSHRTNLSGTVAVFDSSRKMARSRPIPIVYASSAAVYGDCQELPLKEDMPVRPRSAYGADKYGCELHARVAAEVYGVPTVGLRLFNVYGPRQDPASPYSGVISIFCDRIRRGLPLNVFGDGSQTRDFVFIEDVVRAFIAAMDQLHDGANVFNVCTGQSTSVLELANLVGELCGSEPQILFQPSRSAEIPHSLGDGRLLSRRLALSTSVTLRSGLTRTLSWMKETETVQGSCAD